MVKFVFFSVCENGRERGGRGKEIVRTGYFRSTGGDNTGGSCLSDCKPVRWLTLTDEISRAAQAGGGDGGDDAWECAGGDICCYESGESKDS